jgi:hypothetical protein
MIPRPNQNLQRRIVAEWDTLQRHDRRTMLQALPLPDLVQLCHALAEHRPSRYLTPDMAYHTIRQLIEPMPWSPDLVYERWACGGEYVFYFGGAAIACHDDHWALWETAQLWFRCCYPMRLHEVATDLVWQEVRRAAA